MWGAHRGRLGSGLTVRWLWSREGRSAPKENPGHCANAVNSYNMIKKHMQGGDPTYRTSAGQHLLAAAEASTVTALMTNPIWVVKTRIFATPKNDPQAYSGLWSEFICPGFAALAAFS